MSGLLAPSRALNAIDMVSPVNWLHPLNRGRRSWWFPQVGMGGGRSIVDLCKFCPLLTSAPSVTWNSVPGGDGRGAYITTNSSDGNNADGSNISHFRSDLLGAAAAWVRPTAITDASRFLSIGRDSNVESANPLGKGDSGDQKWVIYFRVNSADVLLASSTATYVVNTWVRLVTVMTETGVRFFINGREETLSFAVGSASTVTWFGNSASPYTGVRIGRAKALSSGTSFNGQIADASIWGPACIGIANPVEFAKLDYQLSLQRYPGVLNRVRVPVYAPGGAPPGAFTRLLNLRRRAVA